jgi:hypothetical protein
VEAKSNGIWCVCFIQAERNALTCGSQALQIYTTQQKKGCDVTNFYFCSNFNSSIRGKPLEVLLHYVIKEKLGKEAGEDKN